MMCAKGQETGSDFRNWTFDYRNQAGTLRLEAAWSSGSGSYEEHYHNVTLSTGVWYHLGWAVNFSAHSSVLVLDGVSRAVTISGSQSPGTSGTQVFSIGQYRSTTYFDGSLDDIHIYNRALSASEVRLLYNDSRMGYPDTLRRIKPTTYFFPETSSSRNFLTLLGVGN